MHTTHTATILTDLTFGDAGKGSITDALARRQKACLVVRYNGGAQAAHTVVEASGRTHTFRQYGSGTFADGCETFLSRFVLVNPIALLDETLALRSLGIADAPTRLHIDARALVTTPYHVILNQLREIARGSHRHGSCGLGIGETVADALAIEQGEPGQTLRFGDLTAGDALLRRKLRAHRTVKQRQADALLPALRAQATVSDADAAMVGVLLDQLHRDDELDATVEVFTHVAAGVHTTSPEFLAARLRRPGATIFEGAQGVLLDEDWGFHPYTTWSHTTPGNALRLIAETGVSGGEVQTTILGLTRAYQTRHGAGPFPTESDAVTRALPEPHNPTNDWQGAFRAGWLDLALLRYAVAVSGSIDGLVMTCLDRLSELPYLKVGVGYVQGGTPWQLVAENPGCLERREADGKALAEVAVRYAPAPRNAAAYAAWVAAQVGLPLLGTSAGPTAQDKRFDF